MSVETPLNVELEGVSQHEKEDTSRISVQPANVAERDNKTGTGTVPVRSLFEGALTPNSNKKSKGKRKKKKRSPSTSLSSSPSRESYSSEEEKSSTKKKKRSRSNSSSASESEEEKPKNKKTFNLFEAKTKKEENMWKLPTELAHYYNKHSRTFISEKDLDELVKEELPVPNNIRKVPRMDKFITSMRESNNNGIMPEKDKDLERVHNRIRDVMGPLGTVWNEVERYRSSLEEQPEQMDIDSMAQALQKSVMLLSQACNSVTYQRRMETFVLLTLRLRRQY